MEPPPVARPIVRGTILVGGTYSYSGSRDDTKEWYWPGSAFWKAAEERNILLFGKNDPFVWSSNVTGMFWRKWTDWKSASSALIWYATSKGLLRAWLAMQALPETQRSVPLVEVDIISHSHAGQVVAYAAARQMTGFRIRTMITVATPPREDMDVIYQRAAAHVAKWVHIYGGSGDWWQQLGRFGGGGHIIGDRAMPHAHENIQDDRQNHETLLTPDLWTRNGWWRWIT